MTKQKLAWYIARCLDCQPVLKQPFRSEKARDDWASRHRTATGHTVEQFAEGVPHQPGNCPACALIHTVDGAKELNSGDAGTPIYDQMIRRTAGEADPLVKEPKK